MMKNDLDNLRPPWLYFLCKRISWNWFDMTLLWGEPFSFVSSWFDRLRDRATLNTVEPRAVISPRKLVSHLESGSLINMPVHQLKYELRRFCEVMYNILSLKENSSSMWNTPQVESRPDHLQWLGTLVLKLEAAQSIQSVVPHLKG